MLGINEFKKAFLDTRKIQNKVERAKMSAFTKPAARIRLTARQSIKNVGKIPRKDLFELAVRVGMARTSEEYRNLNREQWFGLIKMAGKGFHAPPGKPPFSHVGLLKQHIYYGFDRRSRSMVIGPAKLAGGTGAPRVLEHGGTTRHTVLKRPIKMKPRPYMVPALKKNLSNIAKGWKGVLK